MVTITVAGVPPVSGTALLERSSRSHMSLSASCIRCPWWRGSGSSTSFPSSVLVLLIRGFASGCSSDNSFVPQSLVSRNSPA